jgi:hypothetical protein
MTTRSIQLAGVIKTGTAFLVEDDIKLRKTADIEGNIGKIVRVGCMNDDTSCHDIGSLISIDDVSLIIRSFKSGDLKAYDLNCTNSSVYKDIKVTKLLKKQDISVLFKND